MITNPKDILVKLKKQGETMDYGNFAEFSASGYPQSYLPHYISWEVQVDSLLNSLFGPSSPVYQMFKKNEESHVLGNGEKEFQKKHNLILGSIISGIELLEFLPSVEEIQGDAGLLTNKVFIVHGHDEVLKNQTEIFLRQIGLEPIILHRQADEGQTVMEKFEKHSDVGFAFILLSPDDFAFSRREEGIQEFDRTTKELRARQNVIFEFGFFVGKLTRSRVCCIFKEGTTLPTDVAGLLYKKVNNDIEEQGFAIIKELKAAGYQLTI